MASKNRSCLERQEGRPGVKKPTKKREGPVVLTAEDWEVIARCLAVQPSIITAGTAYKIGKNGELAHWRGTRGKK